MLGYSNSSNSLEVVTAKEIIEYLNKSTYKYNTDTLITIGCFSECFDESNKHETLELIKYFLHNGNQVQLSTKTSVLKRDIDELEPYIKYDGQFIIFVSASVIREHEKYEKNTELPDIRFKSFELLNNNKVNVVLYIKPVLEGITIRDLDLYKYYIISHNIRDVVVGSIFTAQKSEETVHFSNNNKLFYNSVSDENIIIEELKSICNIYRRSSEVVKHYKKNLES